MNSKSSSERLAHAMERARRHWQARPPAQAEAVSSPTPSAPALTIALSREAGAEGYLVAHVLGEKLGWPVYDRQLLQKVAEEMGLHASLLESVDEKQKGWFQECLEMLSSAPMVSISAYVRHLLETLLSLAAHGRCVIVGRGAVQVLPPATTLRVRLVCPLAQRIDSIQKRLGVTREEAARWIERTDAERFRFVQEHLHKDPNDSLAYDLVLNSGRFTADECADLIIEALRRLEAHPRQPRAPIKCQELVGS